MDLRDFVFKEINHQAGVGPADEQLGAAAGNFRHLFEEHLEGGVGPVVVVGQLVAPREFGFHLRTSKAGAHGHDHALALEADHAGGQNGIFQVGEFLLDHAALMLPQFLGQHLLGGGSSHAPEIIFFGGHIQHHRVAQLGVIGHLLHFHEANLMVLALHLFNDDF